MQLEKRQTQKKPRTNPKNIKAAQINTSHT